MEKCPNCGAPLETDVCLYCGTRIKKADDDTKTVYKKTVEESVLHTKERGEETRYGERVSDKSKLLTILLTIFLGCFGIHYFYVGKPVRGIVYFFTIGVFGFGWIIDIFIVLSGNFEDQYGYKVKKG